MLDELGAQRRADRACASAARSAGSPPRTPACTATRSAPCRRAACPTPSSRRCEEPLARLVRRYARTHGPFTTAELAGALRRGPGPGAARARAGRRRWCAASCARAAASASGATPRCCAGCGAPRSRRCARRWSPPSSGPSPGSCPPGRAWTPRPRRRRAWTACASCSCRSRAWRWLPQVWERDVLPRRVGRLLARPGSTSSARAASWSGWAPARSAATPAGWRSTSARTLAGSARRRSRASPPSEPLHDAIRERLRAGAAFWADLLADCRRPSRWSCRRRSGTWCGRAR